MREPSRAGVGNSKKQQCVYVTPRHACVCTEQEHTGSLHARGPHPCNVTPRLDGRPCATRGLIEALWRPSAACMRRRQRARPASRRAPQRVSAAATVLPPSSRASGRAVCGNPPGGRSPSRLSPRYQSTWVSTRISRPTNSFMPSTEYSYRVWKKKGELPSLAKDWLAVRRKSPRADSDEHALSVIRLAKVLAVRRKPPRADSADSDEHAMPVIQLLPQAL